MRPDVYVMSLTGKSAEELFIGPNAPVQLIADSNGAVSVRKWDAARVGVAEPSVEDLASALAEPTPVSYLAEMFVAAASSSCSTILAQVNADPVHSTAYQLAYTLVGPGAVVPTVDPAKTIFANMAAENGFQPQAFADLVAQVGLAGMSLSTILVAAQAAARNAKTLAELTAALTAFESGIANFVSTLNGVGLTITLSAPAAISIPDLNA